MQTVELFAGTRSFSKVARELGHNTFTTDINEIDGQDLIADVRTLNNYHFPNPVDILWASPPCEGFSVAAIGRNWTKQREPKTDSARLAQQLVLHTLRIIDELKPKWWFIENPRGNLRRMPFMAAHQTINNPQHRNDKKDVVEWLDLSVTSLGEYDVYRHTVTYCQYGDTRMKPTDIWTNAHWWTPKPMCKNGDPCHVAAPRGAKTGTQGIKGYKNRSRIPPDLFHEIFKQLSILTK